MDHQQTGILGVDDLLLAFKTTPHGLTESEAETRLARTGLNVITKDNRSFSIFWRFIAQFNDLMIIILLVASLIAITFGEVRNGIIIFVIVLINVTIGFSQEFRAEKVLSRLASLVPRTVRVRRNGRLIQKDASALVPGDLVDLAPGDRIPADGQLLVAYDLKIDESALTGESMAVAKRALVSIPDEKTESRHLVYMGTTVRNGTGQVLVTTTGQSSQFGKLAETVSLTHKDTSPLTQAMARLSSRVAKIALIILAVMVLYGVATGKDLVDQFFFALVLAVAVVPEGLPATVSVVLALAATRLAKKQALVKRLSAVETLGDVTVICTDKTGTLTENKMTVERSWVAAGSRPSDLSIIAALANNAHLDPEEENDLGDPMEIALARWACRNAKEFLNKHLVFPRLLEIPFTEHSKTMSVAVRGKTKGTVRLLIKGAPDKILDLCHLTASEQKTAKEYLRTWAEAGFRVLAFAKKILPASHLKRTDLKKLEQDLTLVGLVAFSDPPREEVPQAVAAARAAGIRVLMLTGDDPRTAESLARRIGLFRPTERTVLIGEELDKIDDSELETLLMRPAIFARITPIHKLRIVNSLKKMGEVVAVTGDGVNDGPALKRADIGIAMGESGTDVAREAADMILLDDNFRTIVKAVEQGRILFANLKKTVWYNFSANLGELGLVMLGSIFQLIQPPIQAIQILATNLGTDILPSAALGFDPADHNTLSDRPRKEEDDFLSRRDWRQLIFVGGLIALGSFVSFLVASNFNLSSDELYRRGTTAAFVTLVTMQIVNAFTSRSATRSIFKMNPFSNRFLVFASIASIALLVAFVYYKPFQTLMNGAPLTISHWLIAIGFSLLLILSEEIRKWRNRTHLSR